MIESLTLADLQKLEALRPDLANFADRVLVRNYDDFVRVLYKDIDRCIAKIEEDPQIRRKDGEDRISAEIINVLNGMNYDASHDEKVGGHSDIVVRNLNGYLWLGEAKIHSDYAYLEKGFNQLCTRYSPGTPNADQGALIVYVRVQDCAAVMAEWRRRAAALGLPEYVESDCPARDSLAFYSSHKHEGAGRTVKVRHIAVKQYFNPKDVRAASKSAKSSGGEPRRARTRVKKAAA
jgi:hypothetical protein